MSYNHIFYFKCHPIKVDEFHFAHSFVRDLKSWNERNAKTYVNFLMSSIQETRYSMPNSNGKIPRWGKSIFDAI